MNLLELIFVFLMLGVFATSAWLSYSLSLPNNTAATLTTLYALKHARMLALSDSSTLGFAGFGDIYSFARVDSERLLSAYNLFFWQLQFHTTGIYTKNSLSIYRDTPRFASTTDYDKRPLAGDIVALHAGNSQCLSGYNNTNIANFCKNNALFDFRLHEYFKLEILQLNVPTTCQERDTFRFYFDDFSKVFCGRRVHTPLALQSIRVGDTLIFLDPLTGYSFLSY